MGKTGSNKKKRQHIAEEGSQIHQESSDSPIRNERKRRKRHANRAKDGGDDEPQPTAPPDLSLSSEGHRGDDDDDDDDGTGNNNVEEDDGEDDSFLMEAAEAWGRQFERESAETTTATTETDTSEQHPSSTTTKLLRRGSKPKEAMATSSSHAPTTATDPNRSNKTTTTRKTFSLHITQLHFDATEWDVRRHFVEDGGCILTSVRLVYDRGLTPGSKQFRGVAFIDCADEASYQAALRLHHSQMLNRCINVRPTLSKQQLVQVVQGTQEKVRQKIRLLMEKKENREKEEKQRTSKHEDHKTTAKKDVVKDNRGNHRRKHQTTKADNQQPQFKTGRHQSNPAESKAKPKKHKDEKPGRNHRKMEVVASANPDKTEPLASRKRKIPAQQQDGDLNNAHKHNKLKAQNQHDESNLSPLDRTKQRKQHHDRSASRKEKGGVEPMESKPKTKQSQTSRNDAKPSNGAHKTKTTGPKQPSSETRKKLTKQQRNRRAAIIMSKRQKR